MTNNLLIKDANNVTREIHTVEDSTSAHYNMSIPINTSGTLLFDQVPGLVSISGPLPAGTLHLGKVSVEGLTVGAGSGLTVSVGGAVSAQAVPAGFSDGSNYRIPYADSSGVQRVSVMDSTIGVSISPTQANIPVSIAGTVNVSLGALTNNLPVSVANTVNVSINGTAPITVSLAPSTTPIAVSAEGGFLDSVISITNVAAVSLGGGSATIGTVSISPTQANIPVSVAGTALVSVNGTAKAQLWDGGNNVAVALGADNADALATSGTANRLKTLALNAWYNRASGTWDLATGSSLGLLVNTVTPLNVSVSPTQANIPVSIGNANNIPVSIANVANVSINGTVVGTANGDAQGGTGALNVNSRNKVFNRNSSTWDSMTGTSVGIAVLPVSIAPQILITHVCNSLPTPTISKELVSVGGATSVQAYPVAGKDTAGDARLVRTHTDGSVLVHVCNAAPGAAGGSSITVSVGGASSVQAVPIAGQDKNSDVRLLKTETDGTLKSSGWLSKPSYQFTRPTDVVAYALGDVVANSTVAGTVVPLSWPVARVAGGSLSIRRAIFRKSGLSITNAAFRLHIFSTAAGVSVSTGDNTVFTSVWSPASKYAGAIDFIVDKPGKDGSIGEGVPSSGNEINLLLTAGATSISGLLEARGAYTPLSGETITVQLECIQD